MLPYEDIGFWSEIKLDIVREYAAAYSRVLAAQRSPSFRHVYIDGFAGYGLHVSRETGDFVAGSPTNALLVRPPFTEYYFIDIQQRKVESLERIAGERDDVHVLHGDCNQILLSDVFPNVRYEQFRRGLCLLDPYGLHLDWQVVHTAGRMKSIEIFLNFPIADMNRNVLRRDPANVDPQQIERMNRYWGDDSWRRVAYHRVRTLFGFEEEKATNDAVAEAFRQRLINVAGFRYVPPPVPMPNSRGAIVYYLFFAARKPVARNIVTGIFSKHRQRMG